jgi:hypothetical protein
MLYVISWKGTQERRNSVIARFLKTGGQPPAGVKMLGRWHVVGSNDGLAVAESNDPILMAKWSLDWSDLLDMEVRPLLTDEQIAPLLAGIVN